MMQVNTLNYLDYVFLSRHVPIHCVLRILMYPSHFNLGCVCVWQSKLKGVEGQRQEYMSRGAQ